MNKNIVIPVVILIIITVTAIVLIIGIKYYNWLDKFGFKQSKSNNYVKNIPLEMNKEFTENNEEQQREGEKEQTKESDKGKTDMEKYTKDEKGIKKERRYKKVAESDIDKTKKESFVKKTENYLQTQTVKKKEYSNKSKTTPKYIKEIKESKNNKAQLKEKITNEGEVFHAEGEYISEQEYLYRVSLIKNLAIKTVVIDKLTKGNGISQEYFKVSYSTNMIPAKVLEHVVESKNFRQLIPKKYLAEETKLNGLLKGDKVIIKNTDIVELLILWTQGKLSPVQKAWETFAEK